MADRDHITISIGRIDVKSPWFGDKVWGLGFNDVIVNGLTLPQLSWGWVGVSLASGVLSQVGGLVFSVLGEALGFNKQSLKDLLDAQLKAIQSIVKRELEVQALRQCAQSLDSISRLMREYNNSKDKARIQVCMIESSHVLSPLKDMGFPAYRLFMNAASLRLSILQELALSKVEEWGSFTGQVKEAIAHHEAISRDIVGEITRLRNLEKSSRVMEPVFGVPPSALPRKPLADQEYKHLEGEIALSLMRSPAAVFWDQATRTTLTQLGLKGEYENPAPLVRLIDWDKALAVIQDDSTRVGDAIVEKWKQSMP